MSQKRHAFRQLLQQFRHFPPYRGFVLQVPLEELQSNGSKTEVITEVNGTKKSFEQDRKRRGQGSAKGKGVRRPALT